MKLNAFQKIITLIYLVTIISFTTFSIPFREKLYGNSFRIVHDVIWPQYSYIDLYRLIIYLGVITIIFYLLLKYYERYNALNNDEFKKKLKLEIRLFIVVFVAIFTIGSFLFTNNIVNEIRINKLKKTIQANENIIERYENKRELRRDFWYENNYIYEQTENNSTISNLWKFLLKNKKNENWLKYYISNFDSYNKERFDIETPLKFKEFIENNRFTREDVETYNKIDILETLIQDDNKSIEKLKIFNTEDYRKILFLTLIIFTSIIYLVRPFFNTILGILKEAK